MRRHTIKLSTSAHYLFLPHENSLYSWQASSVCHQAVTIYNTLSDAPAGLTQHLHTRELCSSKPVSPHQPRKPVPWVTHPAGSSCSQVPHETKAPLLVSTSIAQGSTGMLQLSGLWARQMKSTEVLPSFVLPAPTSLTSPTLAYILWQALWAQLEELIQ